MPNSAKSSALRWLAQRSLTVRELQTRLSQRGYAEEEVQEVVEELNQLSLLDDRRIAEAVVRQSLNRHEGPRHVMARLLRRGVDSEISEAVMAQLMAQVDWLEIAEPLRQRYDIKSPKGRARLMRHMAREGFPAGVIRRVAGGQRSDGTSGVEDD